MRINVVVSCTNRKSQTPSSSLLIRNITESGTKERLAVWTRQREVFSGSLVPARELYAGEYWSVVRSLSAIAEKRDIELHLWVCSAGHGLIRFDDAVAPYAASFDPGSEDYVAPGPAEITTWWDGLSKLRGKSSPTTLAAVAGEDPSAPMLVVLSQTYLAAIADDLSLATTQLREPKQLSVVGSAKGKARELSVGVQAKLRQRLGGTLIALNARVVAHLLETHSGNFLRDELLAEVSELLRTTQELPSLRRIKLSDDEWLVRISNELSKDHALSKSKLLRRVREDGFACEQGRFSRLFARVAESSAAQRNLFES